MARHRFPLVIGHRGYRARYPENTLLGMRKAFEAGADGVECDVQKTADGRYVVIHDPTTLRVTGRGGEIAGMSFEEVRGLDAGNGERIPELHEVLGVIPRGKYFDLELKADTIAAEDCGPIEDILRGRIDPELLMISSFEPGLLEYFRGRGYTVGLLVGQGLADQGAAAIVRTILRLRPQYVNMPMQSFRVLGPSKARIFLRLLRVLGPRLLFWTVNSEEEALAVADRCRIIVTDEVELMLGLKRSRGGVGGLSAPRPPIQPGRK
jgi:glycerophosphoryl diester phosphodiesterase